MTHPDGGNRYAAIGKIAFFACLVLAALAALWFSLTSGGGVPHAGGAQPVRLVENVQRLVPGGQPQLLHLPVTVPEDGPFTIAFDLPTLAPSPDNTLSFLGNYMAFSVLVEGQPVYNYQVSPDSFVKSGGYRLHHVPLPDQIAGGQVEIRVTPLLPRSNVQNLHVMRVGPLSQITLQQLQDELPVIFFSLVMMLFFLAVLLFLFFRRREIVDSYSLLLNLALLGVLVAIYILLQLWTINHWLRQRHLVAYFLEYTVVSMIPLPVLMIVRPHTAGLLKKSISFTAWLLWLNLLANYLLTLSGVLEFREMLPGSLVLFLLSILNVFASLIYMLRHRTPATRQLLVALVPLLVGFTAAVIYYIFEGMILSPVLLLIAFLLSLLVQSFAAVRGYLKLRENALKSDLYRHMATMDTMTGLENRNAYNDLALQMADSPTPGWVAVMDLNRLKVINDTLGHKSGDALLLSFAQHMRAVSASLRDSRLYRIGGDEFLLFTREPADFPMARWLQQQRDAWAHNPTPAHPSAADFAFGAQYWAGDSSFESAVMLADGKMYADKQARRG